MARPLRIEYPGALYHLTSRGNARADIYLSDDDWQLFLDCLAAVCDRWRWLCYAYCLMRNHYHLIIETPEGNLSKGMRKNLRGQVLQNNITVCHIQIWHVLYVSNIPALCTI